MHKFIYDVKQLERFYELLPILAPDESYITYTSARVKYLTAQERIFCGGGGDAVFNRKLIKKQTFPTFLRVIRQMEVARGGLTSFNDVEYPDKCLVLYGNINPVSGREALRMFQNDTMKIMNKLIDGVEDKHTKKQRSLDSLLMTNFQNAVINKTYIDIDFDCDITTESFVKIAVKEFIDRGAELHLIKTKGGYHAIIRAKSIKFDYPKLIEEFDEKIKASYNGEVSINKDGYIPIPGTLQGGFEVKFIDVEGWL